MNFQMKHKLAKKICCLGPNSPLPKQLQVRPFTPISHFQYLHEHSIWLSHRTFTLHIENWILISSQTCFHSYGSYQQHQ